MNTAPLGISTLLFCFFCLLSGIFKAKTAALFFGGLALLQVINRWAAWAFIHWIHALVIETFAIFLAIILRLLTFWKKRKVKLGSGKRPILLIHGYMHDSSGWIYLKYRLEKAGFGPIYLLNLGNPFLSLSKYAEKVVQMTAQINKETQSDSLTLIGHSMGGLVSSWYAIHRAPAGSVDKVITLGTPFDGTVMAYLGLGPNAKEMRRGSEFVRELQKEMEQCDQIQFFHVASKTDQIILPCRSALFGKNVERQYCLDDIGHMALLFSPRVADQLILWLKEESIQRMEASSP